MPTKTTKTLHRNSAAKTSRRRSPFRPATIELVQRLARASADHQLISPVDLAGLRVDLAVASGSLLRSLPADDGALELAQHIGRDRAWSSAAALVLALALTGRLDTSEAAKDGILEALDVLGVDLAAVATSGSWFTAAA